MVTPEYIWLQKFSAKWTHLADAKWYFVFSVSILVIFGIHYFFRRHFTESFFRFQVIYQFGQALFVSLLVSGIVIHFFKFLIGRKRPYHALDENGLGICDSSIFEPLTTYYAFHSLPSGHSQLIFTVVTFLSFYMRSPYIRVGLFLFAFIVALMRVGTRDHFLSDVLLGLLVGILATYFVMTRIYLRDPDRLRIL